MKRHKAGDTEGVADALYAALETTRLISVLLTPFLPHVAAVIRRQLGLPSAPLTDWNAETQWGGLPGGTRTEEAQPIFPRIDVKKTEQKPEKTAPKKEPKPKMEETPPPPPILGEPEKAAPAAATITIEDFAKVQLKIGEIKTADRVEGANKLLRLTVDIGEESPRQILAGIAESYAPETLPGRKIVVVANLAPRKLRGFESQGMLMAATDAEGHAILLHPADPERRPARRTGALEESDFDPYFADAAWRDGMECNWAGAGLDRHGAERCRQGAGGGAGGAAQRRAADSGVFQRLVPRRRDRPAYRRAARAGLANSDRSARKGLRGLGRADES